MTTGFETGSTIGPYAITGPLGAGGMGVVFRATDKELRREVAIKVLPASFTDDVERVARFEREARTLAAFNHYNIAQIFGLERTESGTALVMELVEGPTLADLIARGPLPLEQASEIARQLAAALEAAHERGIVHRDLKPANVIVRLDGVVKVLDFGLAKIAVGTMSESASDISGRPGSDLTEIGSALGTAAYTSPEQAPRRYRSGDGRARVGFPWGPWHASISVAVRRARDDGILGADFGPDGQLATLVRRVGDRTALEFPVGTTIREGRIMVSPRVSPDGSEICFAENYGDLMVAERGGGVRRLVDERLPRIGSCLFSPDGNEVWFAYAPMGGTHTNLGAVRRDGSKRRELASLTSYAAIDDVSPDGAALITSGTLRFTVFGSRYPNERELELGVFDASRLPFLSASGDMAPIWDNSGGSGVGGTLFVKRLGPEPATPVGSGDAMALTPDGSSIVGIGAGTAVTTLTLLPTGVGQSRGFRST
jgi:Protein kinase domain